jgi:hypothetical protein
MGKFLTEIEKVFPELKMEMNVPSFHAVDSAAMMGSATNSDLIENGHPVTVGDALTEMDRHIETIASFPATVYCPLKADNQPLSTPFLRVLIVMGKVKPTLIHELQFKVKTAVASDWVNVVEAICHDTITTSPSFRCILLAHHQNMEQRKAVKNLALEFVHEETKEKRKKAIVMEVTELAWKNILSSSLATLIEAGIGMDIDEQGVNRIAKGSGGSRAGAANAAWEIIVKDEDFKEHPLIVQMVRASMILSQSVTISAIADTVVAMAKKGQEEDEEYFYPQIHAQLLLTRQNAVETKSLIDDLNRHQKDWDRLKECYFDPKDKPSSAGDGFFLTRTPGQNESSKEKQLVLGLIVSLNDYALATDNEAFVDYASGVRAELVNLLSEQNEAVMDALRPIASNISEKLSSLALPKTFFAPSADQLAAEKMKKACVVEAIAKIYAYTPPATYNNIRTLNNHNK